METKKIIPIGSDHAAFEMKEFLKKKLLEAGYEIKDYGAFSTESVDYPDIIHPLAKDVNDGIYDKGLIMCGSGIGVSMVANKYPNVRAALCYTVEQAQLTRQHNDANVLSLAGRFLDFDLAWKMVQAFLSTEFEGGRHQKRVEKIAIK